MHCSQTSWRDTLRPHPFPSPLSVSLEQLEPLAWAGVPALLAGLGWQCYRYRFPPELVAVAAMGGLLVAGRWRAGLLHAALDPWTSAALLALLAISWLAASRLKPRTRRDMVFLGLAAGSLPAAWMGARAGQSARDAGRLAAIGAAAGAASPLGGPVQWLASGQDWTWWLLTAPAGALAIAVSWPGSMIHENPEAQIPATVRFRWFLVATWVGALLHLAGGPWAIAELCEHPPDLPPWCWVLAGWAAGNLVDPWLAADLVARTRGLGATGTVLQAAVVGLTLPGGSVLLIVWCARGWRAAAQAFLPIAVALSVSVLLSAGFAYQAPAG